MKTITVNEATMNDIKERLAIWETWINHPELIAQEDREKVFEKWRGARYILRKLGIKIDELDLLIDEI